MWSAKAREYLVEAELELAQVLESNTLLPTQQEHKKQLARQIHRTKLIQTMSLLM
jgi:hypothetical protein